MKNTSQFVAGLSQILSINKSNIKSFIPVTLPTFYNDFLGGSIEWE
uniref:Uncharacterized protein n=1 Tax=Prochlorococcus marinus XMU1424 TaxID=2774497 RepID=A0A9D9G029_PROMR